jgi:hypothetical protein
VRQVPWSDDRRLRYIFAKPQTRKDPSVTDFLQQTQDGINGRLAELKPLLDEYERLRAAADALDGIPSANGAQTSRSRPGPRRGPGRPRGSRTAAASSPSASTAKPKGASTGRPGRRGRPRGGSKRAGEASSTSQRNPASRSLSLRSEWESSRTIYIGCSPRSSKLAPPSSRAVAGIQRTAPPKRSPDLDEARVCQALVDGAYVDCS